MTYIIMGANGGVGAALARRLTGTDLFLTARNADTLTDLAQETGARTMACDVMQDGAVDAVIKAADTGAGIKGLAYCVGSIVIKPLKAATMQDFLDTFRLNVMGAAQAVQAAASGLKKANGSVVLFSSVAVAQGFANHSVIAAAKGGVEGLTRSLATELAPDIRVNAIAPSLTDTAMAAPFTANTTMASGIAALHPLQRLGTADDQAALAAFLLGPDSGWITGQVIGVDGGRSALRTKG